MQYRQDGRPGKSLDNIDESLNSMTRFLGVLPDQFRREFGPDVLIKF